MVVFRELKIEEIDHFWTLLCTLDLETSCMMYEPQERQRRTDPQELKEDIWNNVMQGSDFLQVAEADDEIVGYIRGERGKFDRVFHTAYVVIGIRRDHSGKGIGTTFFENLDRWARANGIHRLELTVQCRNQAAKRLYEKSGFQVEGVRAKSMLVEGAFIDEYYMAKIL